MKLRRIERANKETMQGVGSNYQFYPRIIHNSLVIERTASARQ
jgi:hypothetical protein